MSIDGALEIRPQAGPQEQLLSCSADIAIFGGGAGGGKSFGLLLDALRHVNTPDAGAVFFRRTSVQITNEGGLWDEANKLYRPIGGIPRDRPNLDFRFSGGFSISFAHLQHDKNVYDFQGAQIPVIYFDELTHFTKKQFWYMQSRNRSVCGIKPYVRATCNPDKSSWVREFIDWWIGEDGLAIPERSGVIRWLCVYEDKYHWFDQKEEAEEKFPLIPPVSATFIPSKLSDNKILMKKDPGYMAKLMALSKVDRERLLGGNWNIMPSAGMFFKRHYFEEVDVLPRMQRIVRAWDRAATEWKDGDPGDPDWTVGFKLGQGHDGYFYVIDIERERYSPGKVDALIKNTARQDGIGVTIKGFQDPGSAGKSEIEAFIKMLSGFDVTSERISVDKVTAAKPASAQAEAGNIRVLSSCKNKEEFYSELENFPEGGHDDIVDAFSSAFNCLNASNVGSFTDDMANGESTTDIDDFDKW